MKAILFLLALPLWAGAAEIEIKKEFLKMADGAELSATFFLPKMESGKKVPVLFEMLPYRKDDNFLRRDFSLCEYFARNGFAVARVDVRGTGGSGGRLPDREYSDAEISDAVRIIELLAKMPWSNGKVGMYGISWSGINSLIVTMKRPKPKALKAVLVAHASNDLFFNDVHFIDGIFHVDEYSLDIDHTNGLPRSPDYKLDKAYFRDRFDVEPWIFAYKSRQRPGVWWEKKSQSFTYPLNTPAFLIGGLLDGYRDTIPEILRRSHLASSKTPVKALIGPWNHSWPDNAEPGPPFEWRKEALSWWKHWLLDEDSGILKEPAVTIFFRESHKPDSQLANTPGFWRVANWPLPGARGRDLSLESDHSLRELLPNGAKGDVDEEEIPKHSLTYMPGAGLELGYWWGEATPDMRALTQSSLVYDTAPLEKELILAGQPVFYCHRQSSAPLAHWVVRLEDVRPDGSVSLVTGGAQNGAIAAGGRLKPRLGKPNEVIWININMHFTTWVFPKGHRLRLSVSNGAFPMFWPTPDLMTSKLRIDGCVLSFDEFPAARDLPATSLADIEPRRQLPGEDSKETISWGSLPTRMLEAPPGIVRTFDRGESTQKVGIFNIKSGQTTSYWVNEKNPAKAGFEGTYFHDFNSDKRSFRIDSRMEVESDRKNFRILFHRKLTSGAKVLREKTWVKKIPRDIH
jgi:putative CocE/NonD family hydrolase